MIDSRSCLGQPISTVKEAYSDLGYAEHDLIDRFERNQAVAIEDQAKFADLLGEVFGH
jgi:hypothetical protein